MNKILLASNNTHKIKEFKKILEPEDIELIPQSDLGIPEIPETGLTFLENSILKARNASLIGNLPAIADDSGIEVDALSGRPGIFSARYAGEQCDDEANNKLLLKELSGVPQEKRTARYRCVIVYLESHNHPTPRIFDSSWEGYIVDQQLGENGFGYDPLFYLPDLQMTAAELSEDLKNRISHRGKALSAFKKELSSISKNLYNEIAK